MKLFEVITAAIFDQTTIDRQLSPNCQWVSKSVNWLTD